ncbi:MAG: phenylalanine--tRNA ligase subunit beta [Alphaproteobacteria bacterium]|nr:phenylalanine--tRNA ligase subunit beta [Alphaproteobacteria bacterium]
MKFTLGWLKDHLDTTASLGALTATLTQIGLEIEGIADPAQAFKDFVVARIEDAKQHPNADRLRVCMVNTGKETLQVVCGAPNARAGLVGVFAPSGSFVPGTGIQLKKAAIRGVNSNGMMLSMRELGLSDEHDGIIELAGNSAPGSPAADALGLADPMIDVAVTPNRGDCLGVRGIARDLAAAGLGALKPLKRDAQPGKYKSPIGVKLDFPDARKNACAYFVGRHIRGVRNGDSPKWLQDRLKAIGLRPISALVDITNLVTFDLARPLHVFDAAKLKGDVCARLGRAGEKLAALNGKTYELDGEMTVIADQANALALGGIIGGEASGCTATTTDVFVESAWFDPVRTAATGRRLEIVSDARYRFERGIDPAFLKDGMEIATRLIIELCGGEASEVVSAGQEPAWRRTIGLRPERVRTLAGLDLSAADIERILKALGFEIAREGNNFKVTPPSWRADIVGEACLVEEVARIHGYDKIPATPLPRATYMPGVALTPSQRRRAAVRRTLAGRSLVEAVTFSFLPAAQAALFGGGAEELKLVNPISSDLDAMRPSLLPNLIAAAARNAARGIADAALFEVGPRYAGAAADQQSFAAAGVRTGVYQDRSWAAPARAVDVFDAKADALAALAALDVPAARLQTFRAAPGWYHPGRSGALGFRPKAVLAYFGEINPRVLKAMDAKGPVAAFEIVLDALPAAKKEKGAARALLNLSAFQPLSRDFAFVVDKSVAAEAVVRAAMGADKDLIAGASVFDVFSGKGLPPGKKSVAIGVTLQPADKTLTDAEIEAVAAKIVAAVAKATGAALRA